MSTTTAPLFPTLRLRRWQGVLLALLAVVLAALLVFVIVQPIKVLPRIRLAPGFALRTADGSLLTNESLRGRFVLYSFTYVGCQAHTCPETDAIMRAVQSHLRQGRIGEVPVSLVTIVLDPENATAAALQAYAGRVGADPAIWHFVTGDPTTLKTVVGAGFEVFYEAQADGSYVFSPAMFLVDGWGIVRAAYRPVIHPPSADRILQHLNVLEREVRNSRGIARLGYEAAHLFLCYAP
ncbi:MAG: SCO family protein [Anaerolineae bacterium]|nr:SCO family protein [Caldilineales bacterium]MCX7852284.1 SCO family protein [Caldilineales bacterium]MDW8269652.1 SCO family protein [Anaerolineae bacterium]